LQEHCPSAHPQVAQEQVEDPQPGMMIEFGLFEKIEVLFVSVCLKMKVVVEVLTLLLLGEQALQMRGPSLYVPFRARMSRQGPSTFNKQWAVQSTPR